MQPIKTVDAAGLQAMLQQGGVVLIDVRTDAEVARGYIEGARHIPLQQLPSRLAELDTTTPTVIYCQSGNRSGQACGFLATRGYSNMYNLQGGILAWANEGMPIAVP